MSLQNHSSFSVSLLFFQLPSLSLTTGPIGLNMTAEIDYKAWTIHDFMKECHRLGVKAQSFVFLLSKVKEQRYLEHNSDSLVTETLDKTSEDFPSELDEDMDDGVDDLSIGPCRSMFTSPATPDLDPSNYPKVPSFQSYTVPALIAAYEDRKLILKGEEVGFSRPLLVKSLIQHDFCAVEKRFHRQMARKPQSQDDTNIRRQLVVQHFELEEKCLNVLVVCDKELAKEKSQLWNEMLVDISAKREEWLMLVEDLQGVKNADEYAGLGFMERWF